MQPGVILDQPAGIFGIAVDYRRLEGPLGPEPLGSARQPVEFEPECAERRVVNQSQYRIRCRPPSLASLPGLRGT
jgi:hypothetical protein